MLKIAIVEDDQNDQKTILDCLKTYSEKKEVVFDIHRFQNALTFLADKTSYDIVFFDIEMPHMTGMEAAKKLREKDQVISIVFITRVRQYAIEGYSVGASDYLLKPVNYDAFEFRMDYLLSHTIIKNQMEEYTIKTKDSFRKIHIDDILYIESYSHKIIFHTSQGNYETWDSLSHVESQLSKNGFLRTHASYLVNINRITRTDGQFAYINEDKIKISEDRKKQFLMEFAKTIH